LRRVSVFSELIGLPLDCLLEVTLTTAYDKVRDDKDDLTWLLLDYEVSRSAQFALILDTYGE
jgi:hypothetical protein